MDWLPFAVQQGGPWAILLAVVLAVFFLILRGVLVVGPQVDRTIAGYLATISTLEKELTFWREAASSKDATIAEQAKQIQTLTAAGANALEAIARGAKTI